MSVGEVTLNIPMSGPEWMRKLTEGLDVDTTNKLYAAYERYGGKMSLNKFDDLKHAMEQPTTKLGPMSALHMTPSVRTFDTGATRSPNADKYDYEGFLSPLVIERYGEYMHKHRLQTDGSLRASDNWQKGIPVVEYMKSMFRHVIAVWTSHRGFPTPESRQDNLCAILFNASGMLHEELKQSACLISKEVQSGK